MTTGTTKISQKISRWQAKADAKDSLRFWESLFRALPEWTGENFKGCTAWKEQESQLGATLKWKQMVRAMIPPSDATEPVFFLDRLEAALFESQSSVRLVFPSNRQHSVRLGTANECKAIFPWMGSLPYPLNESRWQDFLASRPPPGAEIPNLNQFFLLRKKVLFQLYPATKALLADAKSSLKFFATQLFSNAPTWCHAGHLSLAEWKKASARGTVGWNYYQTLLTFAFTPGSFVERLDAALLQPSSFCLLGFGKNGQVIAGLGNLRDFLPSLSALPFPLNQTSLLQHSLAICSPGTKKWSGPTAVESAVLRSEVLGAFYPDIALQQAEESIRFFEKELFTSTPEFQEPPTPAALSQASGDTLGRRYFASTPTASTSSVTVRGWTLFHPASQPWVARLPYPLNAQSLEEMLKLEKTTGYPTHPLEIHLVQPWLLSRLYPAYALLLESFAFFESLLAGGSMDWSLTYENERDVVPFSRVFVDRGNARAFPTCETTLFGVLLEWFQSGASILLVDPRDPKKLRIDASNFENFFPSWVLCLPFPLHGTAYADFLEKQRDPDSTATPTAFEEVHFKAACLSDLYPTFKRRWEEEREEADFARKLAQRPAHRLTRFMSLYVAALPLPPAAV